MQKAGDWGDAFRSMEGFRFPCFVEDGFIIEADACFCLVAKSHKFITSVLVKLCLCAPTDLLSKFCCTCCDNRSSNVLLGGMPENI